MPRSSRRSYSRRGSIAVARSRTFSLGDPQKASWPTRRRRRSARDIRSELGMRSLAIARASAAASPPMRRNSSRMRGAYSSQWPSASIIGWFRRERSFRAAVGPSGSIVTSRHAQSGLMIPDFPDRATSGSSAGRALLPAMEDLRRRHRRNELVAPAGFETRVPRPGATRDRDLSRECPSRSGKPRAHLLGEGGHLLHELVAIGGEEFENQVSNAAVRQLDDLIDQGSSLAREHPSAVGRSRHTLARPKDAHSLRSVMVGGSVRPRTLERRVSSARPARSSSGERLIGCQAAPNWTVRRSAALLCPLTQIGGYGFCSGLGSKTSPLNCVYLPVNDGSRLVQSSRRTLEVTSSVALAVAASTTTPPTKGRSSVSGLRSRATVLPIEEKVGSRQIGGEREQAER